MRKLDQVERHMFKDQKEKADELIGKLVQSEDDFKNIVMIERIGNILIIRLRKFIKEMDENEIYEMLKELPSLKKMRAPQKHKLAGIVKEFWV